MATASMSEAKTIQDYQTVLDVVSRDMINYMELLPVLMELLKPTDSPFEHSTLRDLKEKSSTTSEKIKEVLQLVNDNGRAAYDLLKQCLRASEQNTLADLLEAAEKGEDLSALRETLKSESVQSPEDKLFKVLKKYLITHYLEYESTMPVAPLAEQHDIELTKFYVRPPMMSYDKPNAFGQNKQSDEQGKTQITSYRALLFNKTEPYKKIYVTADAGMGKTSFSKMLARTWCQAHKPDMREADKFVEDDIDTMKVFDFVFLIHLRDYQSENICSLDKMILRMLKKLPEASRYSKELLEQILRKNRCLTILDGLDEWIHPKECKNPPRREIPHTTSCQGCTVLTTTRPWKFSTAQLSTTDVDRHVEISLLDEASSEKLETLAIDYLNENQSGQMTDNTKCKRQDDFQRTEAVGRLGFIRFIPYILLQMVCLWFENTSVGKSLCEVYSNIVELTLTRWLVKTDSGHENCDCNSPETDIKCMKNNTHCRCYMWLLQKIGKLAFYALLNKVKEITLLFDKTFSLEYLGQDDLNLCLKTGLLSQVKDTTAISSVRFKVMFPHKSIQEFFAAFHIASDWDEHVKETILDMCTSVSSILGLCDVFRFVCGMKPELYFSVSRQFAEIVSQDSRIIENRKLLFTDFVYIFDNIALDYQSMQVACFQESIRNEHNQCQIVLDDIILDENRITVDDVNALAKIIPLNTSNMKTLFSNITGYGTLGHALFEEILQIFRMSNLPSLEYFHGSGKLGQSFLTSIHTAPFPSSLKFLGLHNMFLTDDDVTFVTGLNTLHGLHLNRVILRDESLIDYVSACVSLKELILTEVEYMSRTWNVSSIRHPLFSNFYIRTESLLVCSIQLNMPHETIEAFISSIQKNRLLTRLKLNITCADHHSKCSGVALDLQCHNKLENLSIGCLSLTSNIVSELYINTDQLLDCSTNMVAFSADAISSFLAGLHEAPALETLTLYNLKRVPDRVVIPCLRHLVCCVLMYCDLGDRTLSLSPELTSLKKLAISGTTMRISSWREVITCISKLPQFVLLEFGNTTMAAVECSEVLTCLCELPQHITVLLYNIIVNTDQWKEVVTCISVLQLPVTVFIDISGDEEIMNFFSRIPKQRAEVFTRSKKLTEPIRVDFKYITVTDKQGTHTGSSEPVTVKLKTETTNRLREIFILLGELTQPFTVRLTGTKLTTDQWRELFTSISELPQHIPVVINFIEVNTHHLTEDFTYISTLQLPVTVELKRITAMRDQDEQLFTYSLKLSVELRDILITGKQCKQTDVSKPITVTLDYRSMATNQWKEMFTSISELPQLATILFTSISLTTDCWRDAFTSISKLPQHITMELDKITVTADQWRDIFTSISELPQHITMELTEITVTADQWRDIFTSISELPQHITMELKEITVTADQWRDIFTSISELPQHITMELTEITVTADQWRDIFTSISELPQHITMELTEVTVTTDQWREVVTCINMLQLPVTVKLENISTTTKQQAFHTEKLTGLISVKFNYITVTDRQCTHTGIGEAITVNPMYTTVTLEQWRETFNNVRQLPQLVTVQLENITLTTDQWRDVFACISNLPQSVGVRLMKLTMTSDQWRELLFRVIGKLQHSRHVTLKGCKGPSKEQWEDIVCDMKSSRAFNVFDIGNFESYFEAEFDVKRI